MAEYLPIRAYNRSQKIRIGTTRARSTITTFVNLENQKEKKEFNEHVAIGAVYVVGPIRTSLPVSVVSGFVVTAVTPGTNKKVTYTEGKVFDSEGNLHTVAEGTTAAFEAAAANPRIDVVEVKTDGSEVKIKKGTESATPAVPATDAGYVAIAQVALAKEFTEVKQENITDVRTLY